MALRIHLEMATVVGITTAFGEAYIAALDMLFIQNNGEPPASEEVAEAFEAKHLQFASDR
jgi:hypothetical protein